MATNYDANYDPNTDTVFDKAPFTAEDHTSDAVDADTPAKSPR